VIRFGGGLLYLSGMLLMAYNTYMTVRDGREVIARIPGISPAAAAHA
jgi:cytochrome c oxidase cbb3-type subunit 1